MTPDLLTVPEVAAFLRTTPAVIYNKVADGSLPGVVRVGRRVLVRRRDLLASLGVDATVTPSADQRT